MFYVSIFLLVLVFLFIPDSEYPVAPMPDIKPILVYEDHFWSENSNNIHNNSIFSPAVALQKQVTNDSNGNLSQLLLEEYVSFFADLRNKAKNNALTDSTGRKNLYLLLEGGRAKIEEILINNKTSIPPELFGTPAPSSVPSGKLAGMTVHSGDLLLSKGPDPQSAFFTRFIDYPSVYSHIAMVYVDEITDSVFVIEAHAFQGVVVRKCDEYLTYPKRRIMILRLRSDLPEIIKDPMLPHKAALYALKDALERNALYDFKFDHKDSTTQFCSEIPYYAYKSRGVFLWEPVPKLRSSVNTKFAAALGAPSPELLIPSYLEYDPRLVVTAEWFNLELLYEDHMECVIMDAMIRNNPQQYIKYKFYELPYARLAKAYSGVADLLDADMIIPPEMTATAALRFNLFLKVFQEVKYLTIKKAEDYSAIHGTLPDIRQLARFAEDSLKEYNNGL